MAHPRTPVLIGAGQYTYRGDPLASPPPLASMHVAVANAAKDAGLSMQTLGGVDMIAVVGFTTDSGGVEIAEAHQDRRGEGQPPAPRQALLPSCSMTDTLRI